MRSTLRAAGGYWVLTPFSVLNSVKQLRADLPTGNDCRVETGAKVRVLNQLLRQLGGFE